MVRKSVSLKRKLYLRKYQREWMAKRRAKFFNGRACASCGSLCNLELDHINPVTKVSHCIWSWSERRRLLELEKCQVLCHDCHKLKTKTQTNLLLRHGTRTMYNKYGCRCSLCREINTSYRKMWRLRNK